MKKKKIVILIALLVIIVGAAATIGMIKWKASNASEEETLAANQSYIYGQIESIAGNDMNLALAEAVTKEQSSNRKPGSSNGSNSTDTANPSWPNKNGASSGKDSGSGDMPSGGFPGGGDIPSGGFPGGFPGGDTGSSDSNTQSGKENSKGKDSKNSDSTNTTVTTYNLTGEKAEYRIPVGTSVTTQLGAVTTFTRLAAGDYVKMLVEKDENGNEVILQIWIVG